MAVSVTEPRANIYKPLEQVNVTGRSRTASKARWGSSIISGCSRN